MTESEIVETRPPTARENGAGAASAEGKRNRSWAVLLLYVTALALIGLAFAFDPYNWQRLLWRPRSSNWLLQVGLQASLLLILETAAFALLGFLAGRAWAPLDSKAGRARLLSSVLIAFVFSTLVAVTVRMIAAGFPLLRPSFLTVGFLGVVSLWGSRLGVTWTRAQSRLGWLAKEAIVTAAALTFLVGAFTWLGSSGHPWVQEERQAVPSEDRRRLVKIFRENHPRRIPEGEIRTVVLTERDINQLAAWGFSVLAGRQAARFEVNEDELGVVASANIPRLFGGARHLNVATAGRVFVRDGDLGFRPRFLRLGSITIPEVALDLCGPVVLRRRWQTQRTAPLFHAVRSVRIRDDAAHVTYGHLDIEKGFISDALVGLGFSDNLEPATSAHVTHLINVAQQTPDLSFDTCVEEAFGKAKIRSRSGDPVHENRAAIAALGYLVGHRRIGTFVGTGLPVPSREVQRTFRRVKLRDRQDWARHFCVSAGLQVLGNTWVSKDIGLLKEELDARGGSGFSFGDLLADRAGTKLAEVATESPGAATAVQQRLAGGFRVSELVPPAADLPEGLTAEEFEQQYGGTRGARYRQLLSEIDQRIESSKFYEALR